MTNDATKNSATNSAENAVVNSAESNAASCESAQEKAPVSCDKAATSADNARPLEPGQDWRIGGQESQLSDEEQLEQLYSYLDAHYELPDFTPPWKGGAGDPLPADRYSALLPDRITHASMLVLGAGGEHEMPGVAFADELAGLDVRDVPELGAQIYVPGAGSDVAAGAGADTWAISLHSGGWWRGSGQALEMQWRPEVAAAAALSGVTVMDLDYPLAPEHSVADMLAAVKAAADYARAEGASKLVVWGYSSGGALAALTADASATDVEIAPDALLLTFPDLGSVDGLPDDIKAGLEVPGPEQWPRTLLQVALNDEIAARPELPATGAEHVEVEEYVARHRVSTPTVARERVKAAAEFLRRVAEA